MAELIISHIIFTIITFIVIIKLEIKNSDEDITLLEVLCILLFSALPVFNGMVTIYALANILYIWLYKVLGIVVIKKRND